jgi:hypothetical protein
MPKGNGHKTIHATLDGYGKPGTPNSFSKTELWLDIMRCDGVVGATRLHIVADQRWLLQRAGLVSCGEWSPSRRDACADAAHVIACQDCES